VATRNHPSLTPSKAHLKRISLPLPYLGMFQQGLRGAGPPGETNMLPHTPAPNIK